MRRLYRADATDPRWYHLWLDTTAVGYDAALELVLEAVRRFQQGPLY